MCVIQICASHETRPRYSGDGLRSPGGRRRTTKRTMKVGGRGNTFLLFKSYRYRYRYRFFTCLFYGCSCRWCRGGCPCTQSEKLLAARPKIIRCRQAPCQHRTNNSLGEFAGLISGPVVPSRIVPIYEYMHYSMSVIDPLQFLTTIPSSSTLYFIGVTCMYMLMQEYLLAVTWTLSLSLRTAPRIYWFSSMLYR
jgi:hypothetical protein